MTNHRLEIAAVVRGELAAQKKTYAEAAAAVGVTAHTMGRRLSGQTPFNVDDLVVLARWLDVPVERFVSALSSSAVAS